MTTEPETLLAHWSYSHSSHSPFISAERGEFLGFLRDIAKGFSFIATMYLMVFWLIVCAIAIALALQALGMEKSMSAFIAIPTGFIVAYKLFAMYQDWRKPGPKQ